MSSPTQTCELCGRKVTVVPDGRGFPPDIARRRLEKFCRNNGCPCQPRYRTGILLGPPPRGMST